MRIQRLINFFFTFLITCGCSTYKTITYTESVKESNVLKIHEGFVSRNAQRIKYIKDGKKIAIIEMSKPVMVAMADQEEKWGYFQFPSIGKTEDGILIVNWSMNTDSHKTYGTKTDRDYVPMMSTDCGKTWKPQDNSYDYYVRRYNVKTSTNRIIEVNTPKVKDIRQYELFPKPVARDGRTTYYLLDSLPEDLQGVYFSTRDKNNRYTDIHAKLIDKGLVRYASDNLMPVVWWGNIKELADKSLIAGVYPCLYLEQNGDVTPTGVSFYRSTDNGYTWEVVGKIPSLSKEEFKALKEGDGGFTEPAIELLADSTMICVVRTGSESPMFKSFSYDFGNSWTIPEPFTPNGVKPNLLLLNNGVLVLSSGRPGVQLRFSIDGAGKDWTDPIEMIPYCNNNETYSPDVSCGYTSIIDANDNSFYIVYSDFSTVNSNGDRRKSIWFRKVSVIRM